MDLEQRLVGRVGAVGVPGGSFGVAWGPRRVRHKRPPPGWEGAMHKGWQPSDTLCHWAAQQEQGGVVGSSCMGTALPDNRVAQC